MFRNRIHLHLAGFATAVELLKHAGDILVAVDAAERYVVEVIAPVAMFVLDKAAAVVSGWAVPVRRAGAALYFFPIQREKSWEAEDNDSPLAKERAALVLLPALNLLSALR